MKGMWLMTMDDEQLLREATEGNVQIFELSGESVLLVNLADVSHAEVVYQ